MKSRRGGNGQIENIDATQNEEIANYSPALPTNCHLSAHQSRGNLTVRDLDLSADIRDERAHQLPRGISLTCTCTNLNQELLHLILLLPPHQFPFRLRSQRLAIQPQGPHVFHALPASLGCDRPHSSILKPLSLRLQELIRPQVSSKLREFAPIIIDHTAMQTPSKTSSN